MKGACVFIFFMICNAILGLKGLGMLIFGILGTIPKKKAEDIPEAEPRNLQTIYISRFAIFLSIMVIGSYITIIFILGTFSKNRRGVLIAYFVLILILVIVDIALAAFFGYLNKVRPDVALCYIGTVIFGVSAGFSALTFVLALIYFILIGKENNPQLLNDVRNMEYMNIPLQYQNV